MNDMQRIGQALTELTDFLLGDEQGINADAFERLLELHRILYGEAEAQRLNRDVDATDGRFYFDMYNGNFYVAERLTKE